MTKKVNQIRRKNDVWISLLIVLALVPSVQAFDTDSPYGVVAFIPSPTRWDAMQNANIIWNRCGFSWRDIETSKGNFNWGTTDDAVNQANTRGLKIYAGLGYTPVWASSNAQHRPQDPPTNSQDWYDFVFACVSRYKGSIHYWEIWNEPNLSGFWAGTRSQWITNILIVGSNSAHAADPDCMVVAPEISTCGGCGTIWMTDSLAQAGDKIDIICHHQYGGGDTPAGRLNAIDSMHNTIVSAGYANKPIWITECGWESDSIGEQAQANDLVAMLAGMPSRPWWKKFYWYQIWEGPTGRAGLLHQDETPKLDWYAYRDYTVAHPAPQMVSVNLSTTDIVNGITLVTVGDGNTTPATIASRSCRRNTNAASDFYMYFNVNDTFAFQGNRPAVAVNVDYYDGGTGSLTLEYDANTGEFYKNGGSIALTNKNTWKQFTFNLTNAYFGNRQNNGADFRLSLGSTTFYLDVIQVDAAALPPPGQATSPNPADTASNVSTTATLSWTAGGNALNHDVYFGTTSPGTFRGNQTATTYNPGALTAGTTYYWRIDENNAGGTTTGAVWSFTTTAPPRQATNPNPANAATDIANNATLSWTAGANATSHDVYFGTISPGTFRGNQPGTTYNPGALTPGTAYFWRIDEKNAIATTTGTVWSFTTAPAAGPATNPTPANSATGVTISATLSWIAGNNATSHDVYFGTTSPGTFRANQPGTTYNPETLTAGITYYWRIDEKNAAGTTTGAVWTFKIRSSIPADFDNDGDVDMADFAHMQACFTGNTLPYGADCSDTDLDGDGDVDGADFNSFLPCLAGADHTPGC